jgi:hypothetical protein
MENSSTMHPKYRAFLVPCIAVGSLLVVEDFLYNAANNRYFEFNRHKGWTPLIALAVAFTWPLVLFALSWISSRFNRPIQFGLGTLLALVFVTALPCLWVAQEVRNARSQADLVRRICSEGGNVGYLVNSKVVDKVALEDSEHGLLATMLGRDFFWEVGFIGLDYESPLNDEITTLRHVTTFEIRNVEGPDMEVDGFAIGCYCCGGSSKVEEKCPSVNQPSTDLADAAE